VTFSLMTDWYNYDITWYHVLLISTVAEAEGINTAHVRGEHLTDTFERIYYHVIVVHSNMKSRF